MNSPFIPIRFDKSHLSSIGSRMYSQSFDLIRELVANAYDADATRVLISADTHNLLVEDNGSGMDRVGLEQYFTIGSPFKKENPVSPKYKRVRIGEFGIGKFAVLSLCDRFELYTNCGAYAATVIFDRSDFENREDWNVPVIEHKEKDATITETRVTLYALKKSVSLFDLERYLINLFPLHDRNFSIFLNERKLEPKFIPGERFKIYETTEFGTVKGEIILSSLVLAKEQTGIGIRVKDILIKRETFGIESGHEISTRRLTGEVKADFLPITTDRNNFIVDTPEYNFFYQLMTKKLRRVIRQLEKSSRSYQDKKAEKLLSDALVMIPRHFYHGRPALIFKKERKKNRRGGNRSDWDGTYKKTRRSFSSRGTRRI